MRFSLRKPFGSDQITAACVCVCVYYLGAEVHFVERSFWFLCRLKLFMKTANLFACFTGSWIQVKRWLSLVELQKNICNAWTGMLSKAFKIPSHIITSSSSYIIQNGSMSTAVIAKATPQRKRRTGRVRKKERHKNAEETRKTDTRSEKKSAALQIISSSYTAGALLATQLTKLCAAIAICNLFMQHSTT